MTRDVWHRIAAREIQPHLFGDLAQRSVYAALGGYQPASRRIADIGRHESVFRNFDIEMSEPVACLEQAFLSGILQ
jgi:hypothetical protein